LVDAGVLAGSIGHEHRQPLDLEMIEWSDDQRQYFSVENPFQVSEDLNDFGHSWALVDTHEPYLEPSERIHALLHGIEAERPFYCACHLAEVVYTSRKRFLCMSCGKLHCVLKDPLQRIFKQSLSEQDWFDHFDDHGSKREEEIDLELVDFLEIENAPKIWITHYYEEATSEFVFFTRATKEELEKYYRSTASAEDFIQAGWSHVPTPPSLVYQLADTTFDFDKISNALSSLTEGILSYQKARTEIDFIKHGVLQLFHTVELVLKNKLESLDPKALARRPDNPAVLRLLQGHGVSLRADELRTVNDLRALRNLFQHAEAKFNYRSALKLIRSSIIFIDRFCLDELNLWIAEHIDEIAWQSIMSIAEIEKNAARITSEVIETVKTWSDHEISACPSCRTETVVSKLNRAGICLSCRRVPKLDELENGS
jgi:hypothetical protein